MSSSIAMNSDEMLKVQRQYDSNYNTIYNSMQNDKAKVGLQVKKEKLCLNTSKNTQSTFEVDERSVYNAVWKENYFVKVTDLNKPRSLEYMCVECNETFVTKLSILTHSQFHQKSFCIMCLLYFDNQQDRNKHLTASHADLIKLTAPQDNTNHVDTTSSAVTLQSDILRDIQPATKSTSGRKPALKNRFPPLRKKNKVESVDPLPEVPTKTIKSRFGRCITVKMPNY